MTFDPSAIGSPSSSGVGTVVGDLDPAFDDCSDGSHTSTAGLGVLTGANIGELLDTAGATWLVPGRLRTHVNC